MRGKEHFCGEKWKEVNVKETVGYFKRRKLLLNGRVGCQMHGDARQSLRGGNLFQS